MVATNDAGTEMNGKDINVGNEPVTRHVDDFIDDPTTDRYAASWFESFRRPAWDKLKEPDTRKLFATYKGRRFRVTGCSRLGDVWLHSNFDVDVSYQHRVNVDECSGWSAESSIYKHASDASNRCGIVVGWTSNERGDACWEIECGKAASFRFNETCACAECIASLDEDCRRDWKPIDPRSAQATPGKATEK